MSEEPAKVPILRLVLAWGFVGVPLVWGVVQTVLKAWALFK
jgi:hypothetical protein